MPTRKNEIITETCWLCLVIGLQFKHAQLLQGEKQHLAQKGSKWLLLG